MLMDFLKRIFKKKVENHWYYFNIKITNDLFNHPEVSKDSPIRYYKSTYNFKYCPITKEIWIKYSLQKKYYKKDISILILKFGIRIQEQIDIIDKKYKRRERINKII
jgi:hypothetical protein